MTRLYCTFVYTTICNYVLIRTLYIFVEIFYEAWLRVMDHSWLFSKKGLGEGAK